MSVNFLLSVKLSINSRRLVAKFLGESNLYMGFSTVQGLVLLIPTLFKGQMYTQIPQHHYS